MKGRDGSARGKAPQQKQHIGRFGPVWGQVWVASGQRGVDGLVVWLLCFFFSESGSSFLESLRTELAR